MMNSFMATKTWNKLEENRTLDARTDCTSPKEAWCQFPSEAPTRDQWSHLNCDLSPPGYLQLVLCRCTSTNDNELRPRKQASTMSPERAELQINTGRPWKDEEFDLHEHLSKCIVLPWQVISNLYELDTSLLHISKWGFTLCRNTFKPRTFLQDCIRHSF
jgi:hypothetical protein